MPTKETKSESATRFAVILIVLSLVNILFFYLLWKKEPPASCTADSVVHAAVKYMISAGNMSMMVDTLKECPQTGTSVREDFVEAVQLINKECERGRPQNKVKKLYKTKPWLTLFTTFAAHKHNDEEKYTVHNNTINNWAALKPHVSLILFTNDSEISSIAKDAGWDLVVVTSDRPPVLKDMFKTAVDSFNTSWYGYSNGDILFMNDFIETMIEINEIFNANHRVLVTGQRTNIQNLTAKIDVTDFTMLKQFGQVHGQLYKTDAEDYFVTSKSFPWNDTLPVVVGRPAYDNWLVGHARCALKSTVVDVTETVMALHQTTTLGGNAEGYKSVNPNVNFDLFKKFHLKPNFIAGLTTCTNYKTYKTFCGEITAGERLRQEKGCACP